MKAYTIFNPEVQRYHKYVFSLHLLKLQDIKGRKACVTSSTPCPVTRSSQNYLKSSKKKSEKKQEIFTENRAIFGRLLNISNSMV